jgi:ribonuclease P protein component
LKKGSGDQLYAEKKMKKISSIKNNLDFKTVYRKRRSKANKYFVMYVLENHLEHNRLGISVSKKVGNSVVRHRLTRLIRESMRLHGDMFNSGLDIVVVARASANPPKDSEEKPLKCADVDRALLHLAKLHKILSD